MDSESVVRKAREAAYRDDWHQYLAAHPALAVLIVPIGVEASSDACRASVAVYEDFLYGLRTMRES